MNRRWIVACIAAEAIGMSAAAGAARAAASLADRDVDQAVAWGLCLVVGGGLVEGAALGWLQARSLGGVLDASGRRQWLLLTVLVAGLGWTSASAPATLAGGDTADQPALELVILGAVGVGAVMGAALGAAQACALRRRVRHPSRWVIGSTVGWAVAMPVIFLGATSVGAQWPWPWVVLAGTATGLAAGAVLGLATGPFVEALSAEMAIASPGPPQLGTNVPPAR